MSIFVKFLNTNATDWKSLLKNITFKSLDAYEFECAMFKGIEIIKWADLKIQDVANKARSGGVDTNNISGITAELQQGYRATELPPVVMVLPNGEKQLWDGYNRYNACYNLGIEDFPFLVYELKEEWHDCIEDAYDVVALGANNHTVSKRHTINDFINRGIAYCNRRKNVLSKNEITEWVNNINHTFTPKQVESIVNGIYHQTTVAINILPYPHPKTAQSKVAEIVDTEASTNPVVICCKEGTYIERGFLQIMQNFVEKDIDITDVITYTKGCETAEDVLDQRKKAIEYLKNLDELVMKYATKRLTSRNESFTVTGALPQLIGVEDPQQLVSVDNL